MGELADTLRGIPVFTRLPEPFDTDALPINPQRLFTNWIHDALAANTPEPHAMVLSTVDEHGRSDARTLILKDVDDRGWWFASSADSPKGIQLAKHASAALTFYWPVMGRQVRVRGLVGVAEPEVSARDFLARAPGGRAEGLVGRQSDPLRDRAELRTAFDEAKARVRADPALVAPAWTRYVVQPDEVQFFQGNAERLHVRVRYQSTENGWERTLLWP
jgi:pyridoxamine 5'-phosphate oxidase